MQHRDAKKVVGLIQLLAIFAVKLTVVNRHYVKRMIIYIKILLFLTISLHFEAFNNHNIENYGIFNYLLVKV